MLAILALPAAAQGRWSYVADDDTGRRAAVTCPYGEISAGGYFCLEIGCDADGVVDFLIRLTEAEVQPTVEGVWTVDRREAGTLSLDPVEDIPNNYTAPFDAARDSDLLARMRGGTDASFTILNRPVRANRPFSLAGSSAALSTALTACEEAALAAPDEEEAEPERAAPPVTADSEAAPSAPTDEAEEDASLPDPDAPIVVTAAPAADGGPGVGVNEEGEIVDPVALVLEEIDAACLDHGGTFVEVQEHFAKEGDFDRDGVKDIEVSYAAAVCDAAADLYCDRLACRTDIYRGLGDGTYEQVFSDDYIESSVLQTVIMTFEKDPESCEGTDPCFASYLWDDGELVLLE
ncbi:hypothetical protein [Pelagovum pacificum]|nr:hypothetical protein [Pelagovum pacificum]